MSALEREAARPRRRKLELDEAAGGVQQQQQQGGGLTRAVPLGQIETPGSGAYSPVQPMTSAGRGGGGGLFGDDTGAGIFPRSFSGIEYD